MKTLYTIVGKRFDIILKDKPSESSKMVCFAEIKCYDFFRFDFPVISLHNDKVPYGIPCQFEEKNGKNEPIVKFADKDGDWLMVGGDQKQGLAHKFLTSAKGRYDLNRVISRYILANKDMFGIAPVVATPKINLASEPVTELLIPTATVEKKKKSKKA